MRGIFFAIILLLIGSLLIPLIITTSCDLQVPQNKGMARDEILESDLQINVYNHETKKIMNLALEEYVMQVVGAEMPASFEIEALKAQAVAARTYVIWRRMTEGEAGNGAHPGACVCTSHTHCQEWLSMEELKSRHGASWIKELWPRIEEAVKSTRGIIMTYNMEVIQPLYHSSSGGKTENSEDVFASALPYLKSVSSPFEEEAPVFMDKKEIPIGDFIKSLQTKEKTFKIDRKNILAEIQILERNLGGSIKNIKIGNKNFTGSEIRKIFDLRSADFTIDGDKNNIYFITKGYGHGVGMSQWGANGMAQQGSDYLEILRHYYQGIELSKLKSYN